MTPHGKPSQEMMSSQSVRKALKTWLKRQEPCMYTLKNIQNLLKNRF
jgi:hypothetical protein